MAAADKDSTTNTTPQKRQAEVTAVTVSDKKKHRVEEKKGIERNGHGLLSSVNKSELSVSQKIFKGEP